MTPEEKAKAYDKAIKMAKDALNNGTISNNPIAGLQNIFPELMESDDEGIRKKLISYFSAVKGFSTLEYNYGITNEEAVEWLKKQGKQDGQKVIDKVKPKFKVGDWIITDKKHIWYVDENPETTSYLYRLINQYGKVEVAEWEVVDKHAHLWTIQDTKDGDVLADKSDGTIGIFQNIGHHPDGGSYNDPSYCFLYCRYDDGYFYADFENGNIMNSDDVIPATKEQRDILMKAIADAGYTFDFEKKELEKIEQQPDEQCLPYRKNETAEKLIALAECLETDGDCLFNGLSGNDYGKFLRVLAKELAEVKPDSWNEEDENWFKEMELMCLNFSNDTDYREKFSTWIKSLKSRLQHK